MFWLVNLIVFHKMSKCSGKLPSAIWLISFASVFIPGMLHNFFSFCNVTQLSNNSAGAYP